jgi:hypothetical protein
MGSDGDGHGKVRLKAKCQEALHPWVVATQYGWRPECQEAVSCSSG